MSATSSSSSSSAPEPPPTQEVTENVNQEPSAKVMDLFGFGLNIKIIDQSFMTSYLYPPFHVPPKYKELIRPFPPPGAILPLEKCVIVDEAVQPTESSRPLEAEPSGKQHPNNQANVGTGWKGSGRKLSNKSNKASSSRAQHCIEEYFYAEFIEPTGRVCPLAKSHRMDTIDCPECFSAINITSIVKHVWDHIWDSLAGPKYKENPSFNPCLHCNRNFESEKKLKAHYLAINWIGKHCCMICIREFDDDKSQFDHMRTHHMRYSMPMACKLCPYRSSTMYHFLQHYTDNHILPICLFCLEVFHGGEALCITNFQTAAESQADAHSLYHEIYYHLELHANNGEVYGCDKCVLSFTCASDLMIHQKSVHTNIKLNLSKFKQAADEASRFKRVDISPPACGKYYDETSFKRMLGKLPCEVSIPAKLFARGFSRKGRTLPERSNADQEATTTDSQDNEFRMEAIGQNASDSLNNFSERSQDATSVHLVSGSFGEGTLRQDSGSNEQATAQSDHCSLENLPEEFATIKFDATTAKQLKYLEDANSNLLDDTIVCRECLSPVLQKETSAFTDLSAHYSTTPLKCLKTGCGFSTSCKGMLVMHSNSHRMNNFALVLTDWAKTRNPEEYLLTCYHCMSYFETYEQLARHIIIRKHIALAHSFEDEIREYNERLAAQQQQQQQGPAAVKNVNSPYPK